MQSKENTHQFDEEARAEAEARIGKGEYSGAINQGIASRPTPNAASYANIAVAAIIPDTLLRY